jgi:hypothetical protein
MLRISIIESLDDAITLRLEGRIIDRWVEELSRSCEPILAERRRLILDLAGVRFLDREAITLLWNLKRRQVSFVNCSQFVANKLQSPR